MADGKKAVNTLPEKTVRILLLFYSFSGQTASLLNQLSAGFKEQGAEVVLEKIRPVNSLRFPVGSFLRTIVMMLTTFVRLRFSIEKLSLTSTEEFDLIILAGPTWSYNPSGPVLSLIDRDGKHLFGGKVVLPVISCRGYWRVHWFGLRSLLRKCGAIVPNVMVFSHPNREPWRTLGVFLKIAGRTPERSPLMGKYYRRYGHSRKQKDEAWRFGLQIGEALKRQIPLSELNFRTPISLPRRNEIPEVENNGDD